MLNLEKMEMTNDKRTNEQMQATRFYVNATDSFMSGWGPATNGSYFCVACPDLETAREIEDRLDSRQEMKRVDIADRPRKGRRMNGYHTSIVWHEDYTA